MIRLIQKRLIIPRGDTGFFNVPVLNNIEEGSLIVFSIFDPHSHSKIFEKQSVVEGDTIKINFTHNETVNLKPGKYFWDIKCYKDPQFIDNILINGSEVHSYFAGFSLPICEIRDTSDIFIEENAYSNKINILTNLIGKIEEITNKTESNIKHYPIIRNNYWYTWDADLGDYINTEVKANGDDNIASIELESNNASIQINYIDGKIKHIPLIGFDHLQFLQNVDLIFDANSLTDSSSNINSLDDGFYSPGI